MCKSERFHQSPSVQERLSEVLAILLNRLASNGLPDKWRPEGRKDRTEVRMTADGPPIITPEDLLEAMLNHDGAELHMQVVSRITGFGLGALTATCGFVHAVAVASAS